MYRVTHHVVLTFPFMKSDLQLSTFQGGDHRACGVRPPPPDLPARRVRGGPKRRAPAG